MLSSLRSVLHRMYRTQKVLIFAAQVSRFTLIFYVARSVVLLSKALFVEKFDAGAAPAHVRIHLREMGVSGLVVCEGSVTAVAYLVSVLFKQTDSMVTGHMLLNGAILGIAGLMLADKHVAVYLQRHVAGSFH